MNEAELAREAYIEAILRMADTGLAWLAAHPEKDAPSWRAAVGVDGLFEPTNETCRELVQVMSTSLGSLVPTSRMMHMALDVMRGQPEGDHAELGCGHGRLIGQPCPHCMSGAKQWPDDDSQCAAIAMRDSEYAHRCMRASGHEGPHMANLELERKK